LHGHLDFGKYPCKHIITSARATNQRNRKKPAKTGKMSNLQQMTIEQLKALCKERNITGYSAPLRDGGKAGLVKFIEQSLNVVESVQVPDQDEDEDDVPGAERVEAGGVEERQTHYCPSCKKWMTRRGFRETMNSDYQEQLCLVCDTEVLYYLDVRIDDVPGAERVGAGGVDEVSNDIKILPHTISYVTVGYFLNTKKAISEAGVVEGPAVSEAGGDKKVWVVPKKAAVDPDVDGHLEFHPSVDEGPVVSIDGGVEVPVSSIDGGVEGPVSSIDGDVEGPVSGINNGSNAYVALCLEAAAGSAAVSSIDGVVEGPVVSQSLNLGSEVIVKLDGFSLNGARGVVAGQVDSDLASVSIFNVGDVVVPFCILYPAPSDEPENYSFKLGDEIEVSGYLMDGQQGVVVGCDSKGINVALKSGAVNRIPAWALKKIENPPPPFSFHQIIKIHCLLIERVIETWMAHCGAEIEDGLPVFSFQKHHNLQLVTDAAKEDPFLYMALFSDGDKSGWVGLWLSQEESRYFSGDIQRAKEIFSEIKATVWDFNSLEDISTDTLLKYQKVKWENMGFRQDEDDGMLFFDFEDDRMSHKDDCRFIGNSIIDIDLFEDNYNDEAFVPVTINEKKAVLATGTKSEMRDLYKSLYNLLTIWGTP
jgi:hypothetical protein